MRKSKMLIMLRWQQEFFSAARVFFMASSFRTACFQIIETGKRDFRLMKDGLIPVLINYNR